MSKYRILSLDGGGVRGVLTARILARAASERPGFLDGVALLAGTSAGAINAAGLALGKTPEELVQLYRDQAPHIFANDVFHEIGHTAGLARARYTSEARRKGLATAIDPATTLGQITTRNLLIPTFELDSQNPIAPAPAGTPRSWKAKFFHNFPKDNDGTDNGDLSQPLLDVVVRSSAAPVYFPIYQGFIDGGVVANDPSMCALTQALNRNTGNQELGDLVILSVGTGATANRFLTSRDGDWGLTQWNMNLVRLLVDSVGGLAPYQCGEILGDAFHRINPVIDDVSLDDEKRVSYLINAADAWMDDTQNLTGLLAWLDAHWT